MVFKATNALLKGWPALSLKVFRQAAAVWMDAEHGVWTVLQGRSRRLGWSGQL
ncbi:hypothetical protein MF271_20190 (plasmid) [Deinococcus sp. KNUC1210]|uniref:hypothetical protein n=1 Tax=Deinococcus sp. KNUC1210 TaxID=2917691 RepID=UPI001EF15D5D|nr:hypothetical protein [Deinococcus sp. KNUC1210]ULH17729.1 hypothetical protein MF271_20190 [Deinococcus sp. KNUC1210]